MPRPHVIWIFSFLVMIGALVIARPGAAADTVAAPPAPCWRRGRFYF